MPVTKLASGVPGLDQILKGGIREKSSFLVSGGPGTGKSIFGMQFLIAGAERGEKGLAILYDTEPEQYLIYAATLGINLEKYVKSGLITLLKEPLMLRKVPTLAPPLEIIQTKKIKRVALDSLSIFSYIYISDDREYRSKVMSFLYYMRDVTLLATVEALEFDIDELKFRPEHFLFDGVVFLTKVRVEASFERVLHVAKMRGQEHLMNIYPFTIGKGGITVYPDQLPFSLMNNEGLKKQKK
ncbi:TPA: hypothetical protein HA242_06165 [Candidatus Woesearchaeota archaeon]|nr:hypothetical protein [Candidatus Woesearchaeota archaeon]HIH13281.1 hypothetical protein [Candidatus Woesearchaeota archaeon]